MTQKEKLDKALNGLDEAIEYIQKYWQRAHSQVVVDISREINENLTRTKGTLIKLKRLEES